MKLTHILTGKNDNYAGFFDDRLILTMKYNFHLYKKLGIEAEFILVEWSPDSDTQLLSEKLADVFSEEDFRAYVVRKDIHDKIIGHRKWMTFLEFFAKNVGIQRAKHDFILCSNADIFLKKDVLIKLKNKQDDNTIYRAERHDIDLDKIKKLSVEEFDNAVIKVHKFPENDKVFVDGSGDFTLAHKNVWQKIQGYDENQRFVKIHKDSRFLFSAAESGFQFENLGVIYHIDHGTSVPMTGLGSRYRLANGPYNWRYMLDLPYENLDNWGLTGENISEKKISDTIFEITVTNLDNLRYNDDQAFFIKSPDNLKRFSYLPGEK